MKKYLKRIAGVGSGNYINFWKSKGFSNEAINSNTASNHSITPELSFYGTKTRVELNQSCLKQNKVTYNHGTIVNINIVYQVSKNYNLGSYPTLENYLFGAINFTNHADIDQYKYFGYGIVFDRTGESSFGSRRFGRNAIIFEVDRSSSVNAYNKKKHIFVLGKDFTQELDNTTIYAEKLYSINFTENNKKYEIVPYPLSLGNISKVLSVDKTNKKQD